jgi:hypothetical protein
MELSGGIEPDASGPREWDATTYDQMAAPKRRAPKGSRG